MSHRAHDYRHLIERWRAVAKKIGTPLRRLAVADDYQLFSLTTPALRETGGIYVSAGIHGDEPGSTEGLITWAEAQGKRLAKIPLLILPCLNPWGLVGNIRLNAKGLDLNRSFHLIEEPMVAAVRRLVGERQFGISMMLHEDYDGQGVYLYEVQRVKPYWGEALLTAAAEHLPIDPRIWIDGRKAAHGIHRRRIDRRRFEKIGHPEALWLHWEHSARTFTFETPSEFALERRIAAHCAIMDECVRRIGDA